MTDFDFAVFARSCTTAAQIAQMRQWHAEDLEWGREHLARLAALAAADRLPDEQAPVKALTWIGWVEQMMAALDERAAVLGVEGP